LISIGDGLNFVQGQSEGASIAQFLPTGRDATNRGVALNGNLSFDQPQVTEGTGRSIDGGDEKVKMPPSFAFARQGSAMDVTKRAPGKPQMIEAGEKIIVEDLE
jgi:hypothetical protein